MSGSGLVHWLPFNGDALDDSGNGRDWTLQNSPAYVTGPGGSGQAIEFNAASNEYASIADEAAYDGDGAFSLAFWAQTDSLAVDTGVWQKISGATGLIVYWETALGGYWRTTFDNVSSGNPSDSGADIPTDDSWNHYVITRANGTADLKVYKNGGTAITLSQSTTPTANTVDAEIGRKFTSQAELNMAEHSYWTRELSAAEVAVLYNSGSRLTHSEITFT